MRGTITIKTEVSEQFLMEHCLNMKHAGYDFALVFFFHAFAEGWNIYKINYYLKLLGVEW